MVAFLVNLSYEAIVATNDASFSAMKGKLVYVELWLGDGMELIP